MKFRSIRKGCLHCSSPLTTGKEKFTRVCNICAKDGLAAFDKMGKGDFKGGYDDIKKIMFGKNIGARSEKSFQQEKILDHKISGAISKKETKIRQKLQKQGLSETEINEGLKQYKLNFNLGNK